MILNPRHFVSQLNAKPRWLGTFILLSALSISLYILMHPYLVQSTLAHLPQSATPEDKEVVAQTLRNELPLRCAFLPVRLLIGWSTFAFVLFAICKAFTPPEPVRFIKILSLEVHAEVVNLLAQGATLAYLFVRGGDISNATSLVPFSAAMFVRADTLVSFSLLNSLNFFTLYYIVFLTMGISVQSGLSRTKSFTVVALNWLTYLLLNVGALELTRHAMNLRI
jgi:hypothetical protein